MDKVLVVGGGITGIQASLDLSQLGHEVILLEKEKELGGKLRQLGTLFPKGESAKELLDAKRSQLYGRKNIQIKTTTEIEEVVVKTPGYHVVLRGDGGSLEADAVILTTGYDPFDPHPIDAYGYGRLKDVITAFELEEMLKGEKVVRPSNGAVPKKISFLQCVGSRDRRTNRYCSYFCCTYALKEALALKELNPELEISIMYMDIRTPYLYEHLYTEAREKGIQFIRSRVAGISEREGLLDLDIENTLTRESEAFSSELVVLSIGGVPPEGTAQLADKLKLSLSDHGFFKVEEAPVGTASAGVFIAGAASGLKDIPRCLAEASASALYASVFLSERK